MLKMSHTKQIALEMEAPLPQTSPPVAFLRLESSWVSEKKEKFLNKYKIRYKKWRNYENGKMNWPSRKWSAWRSSDCWKVISLSLAIRTIGADSTVMLIYHGSFSPSHSIWDVGVKTKRLLSIPYILVFIIRKEMQNRADKKGRQERNVLLIILSLGSSVSDDSFKCCVPFRKWNFSISLQALSLTTREKHTNAETIHVFRWH